VPYAHGITCALDVFAIPHILSTHVVLHVAKTAGKLAAVFEALDHGDGKGVPETLTPTQLKTIKDMSADLVVEALRFANLHDFSLAAELDRRTGENNCVSFPAWDVAVEPSAEDRS
jgi:hypothetical protein